MTQPTRTAENSRPIGPLSVAPVLHDFLEKEVFPGTQVAAAAFWQGLAELLRDLMPINQALLARRDELQTRLTSGTGNIPARHSMRLHIGAF